MPGGTASKQRTTERATLAKAPSHSSPRASSSVCKLNEENVVNPPQKPTITKVRRPGLAGSGPSNMVSVPKKEMMKLPATLIRMVPQGNALPQMLALQY